MIRKSFTPMKCAAPCCLGTLTLATIGATLALFIFVTIKAIELKELSDKILIVVIAGLCVSLLLFFLGLYASCCGGKCIRSIVAILFLVYAVGLAALGIVIFAFKTNLYNAIEKVMDKEDVDQSIIDIEKQLKCCGFEDATLVRCWNSSYANVTCGSKLDAIYTKEGYILAGSCLGAALLLFIGTIFAYKFLCREVKSETETNNKIEETLVSTDRYGW